MLICRPDHSPLLLSYSDNGIGVAAALALLELRTGREAASVGVPVYSRRRDWPDWSFWIGRLPYSQVFVPPHPSGLPVVFDCCHCSECGMFSGGHLGNPILSEVGSTFDDLQSLLTQELGNQRFCSQKRLAVLLFGRQRAGTTNSLRVAHCKHLTRWHKNVTTFLD